MWLLLSLIAPALACDPSPLAPTGSAPTAGSSLPSEAALRVTAGNGFGSTTDFDLVVGDTSGPVPGTVDAWCTEQDSPNLVACTWRFVPDAPWAAGATVHAELRQWGPTGAVAWSGSWTVTDDPVIAASGTPTVTVDGAVDVPLNQLSNCDYGSVRTYALTLTQAFPDIAGSSWVKLYRVTPAGDDPRLVREYVAGDLMGPFTVEVDLPPGDGCFQAVQEDAAGELSAWSSVACLAGTGPGTDTGDTGAPVVDTGAPEDTGAVDTGDGFGPNVEEDDVSAGCGCSTSGSGAVGWLAWGLVAAIARRRRG